MLQALRRLGKAPGFTLIAIATLALGIVSNAIIFSALNGLFLHPAGIVNPGHLLAIRVKYTQLNLPNEVISAPDFKDVADSTSVFSSASLMQQQFVNYEGSAGPLRLTAAQVSWPWFRTFGAVPLAGRVFQPEEDRPGGGQVAVLSYNTWQGVFGGDPQIFDRTVQLSGVSYRVIGIMRAEFDWPRRTDVWMPLALPADAAAASKRFNENYFAVARVRQGVSPAQAQAYMAVISGKTLDSVAYARSSGWGIFALPLTEFASGDLRTPTMILLVAVSFVLLIACANIGGLLLARASVRRKEFAVRIALGAGRTDLLRHALSESCWLAALGGGLGVAAAYGGVWTLSQAPPTSILRRFPLSLDSHVLLFVLGLILLCAIVLGLVPVVEIFRAEVFSTLKSEGRTATAGRAHTWLRHTLVTGQMALALILLIGAGLLFKSLANMNSVTTGFDSRGVMTASVQFPASRYQTPEAQSAFYGAVDAKLSAVPGAPSAAVVLPLPFSGFNPSSSFGIVGRVLPPGDPGPHSLNYWITPGYFQTLRIPILAGRNFTAQDNLTSMPVAIVDETLAKQYWPNQNPIGQQLSGGANRPGVTIVGIVAHVMQSSLVGDSGKGVRFRPLLQEPVPQAFLVARTSGDPRLLAGPIQRAVTSVDAGQPVGDSRTLDSYVAASLAPQRAVSGLLEIFSALSLFLAAVGLYGVISYNTARRTQEIGVRIALGAQRRQIWSMVIFQGLRLAAVGILAGAAAAAILSRLLASQLYQVGSFDPLTFMGTGAALAIVAALACYLPALRATQVDPLVALRYE